MKKLLIIIALVLFIGIGGSAFQTIVVEAKPEIKKPERSYEKWGSSITMGVPLNAEAPKVDKKGETVWDYGDKDVSVYDLGPSDEYENGGFEMDVVLKSKPATNDIHFTIEGADYNFFYQPALDEEHNGDSLSEDAKVLKAALVQRILGGESIEDIVKSLPKEEKYIVGEVDHCTETDCYNIFGTVIDHRPENVVGSYAVYSKTKKNHEIGKENYRAGKVAHIYRPKIIDANGNWVWGDMKMQGNQLVVTVPQDFLDNGAYPITVDPALGYNTDPQSSTVVTQSQILGMYYSSSVTMPEDGTAQSVWVWWAAGDFDVSNAKMGIYTFTTLPDSYIDTTAEMTSFPGTAGWLEFTGASASLTSGVSYVPVWWHLADWKEGNLGYDSGAEGEYWLDNETYGGSWPSTFTNDGHDTYRIFGAYIEYTTASPGPGPSSDVTNMTINSGRIDVNNGRLIIN